MDSFYLASGLLVLTMVGVSAALYMRARARSRALAPELSEDERLASRFTDEMIEALEKRLEKGEATVERVDHLRFRVVPVGHEEDAVLASAGRLFIDVESQPEEAPGRIETFLGGLVELVRSPRPGAIPWSEARNQIMPMVVSPESPGPTRSTDPVSFPFAHGLEVRVVMPSVVRLRPVERTHLETWGVNPEEARRAALVNLARRSERIPLQRMEDDGANILYIYENNDGFDAARILLDERWRVLADRHEESLLIAIPNQNFLIAFTTTNQEHLKHIQSRVFDDWMRDEAGRLTWKLFKATRDGVHPQEVVLH